MNKTRPPLVLIEWEDSYNGDHQWFRESELPEKIGASVLSTIGFLVQEQPERLTLAMSYGKMPQDDDATMCDLFTIPTGCIRKRTVLRK